MKKIVSIFLAFCLLFGCALAQEPIKLETVEIEGFIGFGLPSDWEYPELDDVDYENGMLILGVDEEKNLMFTLSFHGPYKGATTQDLMDEFQSYANVELVENEQGTQVVLYEYLDRTMTGFYVLADNGLVFAFTYGHLDDTPISSDDLILTQILEESVQSVYLPEAE